MASTSNGKIRPRREVRCRKDMLKRCRTPPRAQTRAHGSVLTATPIAQEFVMALSCARCAISVRYGRRGGACCMPQATITPPAGTPRRRPSCSSISGPASRHVRARAMTSGPLGSPAADQIFARARQGAGRARREQLSPLSLKPSVEIELTACGTIVATRWARAARQGRAPSRRIVGVRPWPPNFAFACE